MPEGTRQFAGWKEPPIADEAKLYDIVDVLVEIGQARGVSAARIALSWLFERPAVSTLIIGARTEAQLLDNLGAVGWSLTAEQIKRLDDASYMVPPYPYYPYHIEKGFRRINPPVV